MIAIILFISLAIQAVGNYVIWPSRFNVASHMHLGFVFVAYLVPLAIVNPHDEYSTGIIDLYVIINVLGAVSYLVGLGIGSRLPLIKFHYVFYYLPDQIYFEKVKNITTKCVLAGIVGMIVSFAVMGYIPAFAADPSSARFFKGIYHDSYIRIAILFRLSFFLLQTMIPIMIIIWYKEKSKVNLLLIVISIALLSLTLSRGAAFNGILLGIAIICAYKSRLSIFLYTIALILIYVIGSMSFYLVGMLFNVTSLMNILPDGSIWELIASGSPDISDQLTFLTNFNQEGILTYGRTILGGLIPGSYQWNPSIYTLAVVNPGVDVTTIASGGLRLPVSLWGYVSFSWLGVISFSLLSGMINAYCIKYAKQWLKDADLTKAAIIVLLLGSLGAALSDFYIVSMYSIPVILIMMLYCYQFRWSESN